MSEKNVDLVPVGSVPPLGVVPRRMHAWVVRKETHGEPLQSFREEVVETPEPGPNEVLVLSMAAGVNYNGVWGGLGKPVSVLDVHKHPFHIGGSDCAGVVWKVGSAVKRWKVGDEVVLHCNQTCGECPSCNGYDAMGCDNQKIWGYETPYGSFAQFTLAQAQQLMPKSAKMTWEESASYALDLCTAYRMLINRADLRPGETVLVWGGAGGLGTFACQLARMAGALPVAVVSSAEKAEMARSFRCGGNLESQGFPWPCVHAQRDRGAQEGSHGRREGIRQGVHGGCEDVARPGRGVRAPRPGDVPHQRLHREPHGEDRHLRGNDGVRPHVRRPPPLDAPDEDHRLSLRSRRGVLARQRACSWNGAIKPCLTSVYTYADIPRAHDDMMHNRHMGKLSCLVSAPRTGQKTLSEIA